MVMTNDKYQKMQAWRCIRYVLKRMENKRLPTGCYKILHVVKGTHCNENTKANYQVLYH